MGNPVSNCDLHSAVTVVRNITNVFFLVVVCCLLRRAPESLSTKRRRDARLLFYIEIRIRLRVEEWIHVRRRPSNK